MSFLIRNVTTASIALDELGLTIDAGADVDLRSESHEAIATSTDLLDFILAGSIVVIDPSDGVTPLNLTDSADVINSTNSAPYGIPTGGKLLSLEDVDVSAATNADVLTYNGINNKWESKPSSGGTPSSVCFPFYRSDGTLDTIEVISGLFPFYRSDGTYDPIMMGTCN